MEKIKPIVEKVLKTMLKWLKNIKMERNKLKAFSGDGNKGYRKEGKSRVINEILDGILEKI